MQTIDDIQNEVVNDFSVFGDWMEKYQYLIGLGKHLPLIEKEFQADEYLIHGCQSQVWLHADLQGGKVIYSADSDAVITKGIIALLIRVLSGHAPQEILNTELFFLDQIGLKEHLSPLRANGLLNMLKQMKLYAVAFQKQQLTGTADREQQ